MASQRDLMTRLAVRAENAMAESMGSWRKTIAEQHAGLFCQAAMAASEMARTSVAAAIHESISSLHQQMVSETDLMMRNGLIAADAMKPLQEMIGERHADRFSSLTQAAIDANEIAETSATTAIAETVSNLRRNASFSDVAPMRSLYRPGPPPLADDAGDFMNSFSKEFEKSKEEAEELHGRLIVMWRSPAGDVVIVHQLSLIDRHFISVIGIDQHGHHRTFKVQYTALGLSIEVVLADQDGDELDEDVETLVN